MRAAAEAASPGAGGGRRRPVDWLRGASLAASAVAAAFALGLVALFVVQSGPAWRAEGFLGLLLGDTWHYRSGAFGALPMLYGTSVVAALALVLAAPVGLGTAVALSELLPARPRLVAKGAVELLAGVPSVVYGLLGVLLLRDWMTGILAPFEPLSGDTLATGGVLLAVMVLPTVVTLADDALSGVPAAQRAATRALGLSRAGTVLRVVLPQAAPGLAAALLLALGRALGETIAVFLVIGRRDNRLPESAAELLSAAPLAEAGQTLTSKLGGAEVFLAWGDPEHWAAIVALGLVLLALVGAVTGAGLALARLGRGGRSGDARPEGGARATGA